MKKNFVLDTNVLIHNPHSIYSFADNNVIIPVIVIEELDEFKTSPDKKGMHAREVLREIDGLIKKGALKKGAKMSNGGTLILSFGPKDVELPDIDARLNDNKILAVAWDLQNKKQDVFFISKDINARIKAEALGIKSADYEKQKVELNPKLAEMMHPYTQRLASSEKLYGFRHQKQMQVLLKAIALSKKKNKVDKKDVKELQIIAEYFNLEFNMLE